MKLYQQLVLFMLAATVLPLALLGFWLIRHAEAELATAVAREEEAIAQAAAMSVEQSLMASVERLANASGLIAWDKASAEELKGALSLLYEQVPSSSVAVLLDAEGKLLAEPVFVAQSRDEHAPFPSDGMGRLLQHFALSTLRQGGRGQVALSAPYDTPSGAAMAVAVKVSEDVSSPYVVLELGARALRPLLVARSQKGRSRLELVSTEGQVLVTTQGADSMHPVAPEVWEVVVKVLSSPANQTLRTLASPRQWISVAPLSRALNLWVLASLPEAEALAPLRQMRRTVLVGVGLALGVLLVLGLLFTRRLNRRLDDVVKGAEAFARGELNVRIDERGQDELADLSRTFNRMGGELEGSRARLLTWNDELKVRVDEATRDLKEAQARLLQAQKLAAVGQLGAGVAHEINNPLAGILGNAQLLLLERPQHDPDFKALRKIEECAKRCKEITHSLLRFSEAQSAPVLGPVDLNTVVRDAVNLSAGDSKNESIQVELQMASEPLFVRGDPAHLIQVLLALLSNARTAVRQSPKRFVSVRTRGMEQGAVMEVEDTGKGIAEEHLPRIFEPFFTTKDVWSNVGLGLSVAYRVVSEHQGKLDVKTAVDQGSCFTVTLPRVAATPRQTQS